MASSSGKSYGNLGGIDTGFETTVTFDGKAHYLDVELSKRRPSDPSWNNGR